MAKLIFTHPDFAGKTYKLFLEKTSVGRSDANVLVIHHASVSARHCEILVYGTEVIVRDLDSSNGTYVGGRKLKNQQTAAKAGETIQFGAVEARLELEAADKLEGGTDMTAIVTHARAVRDQRRAKANPPPDPAQVLDPVGGVPPEGQTILTPKTQVDGQ